MKYVFIYKINIYANLLQIYMMRFTKWLNNFQSIIINNQNFYQNIYEWIKKKKDKDFLHTQLLFNLQYW